ncbi:MAG: C4-dicarboxylate ABC transporter permease [Betaproteobacteria bacterium RIFCSPHIGHO2_12_FULL_69_13]|nr:MAG: C4-dicarboxylate ABC transporter permease [Betaproteobacteria bacterium RIFCSPHIGHO2_12_FULL_69_13]OGA69717.1 MAG: C4-dicarboxylate ABC transporter permease [Betaproteobacteria bacterium RIFCSPLOWO2_12_FULL_68_20]
MTSVVVGIASVAAIVVSIYAGVHIAVALGLISFIGVVLLKSDLDVAVNLLSLAMADSVSDEAFATVPAFVMMGLVVSRAGLGRDIYDFADELFRPVRGGLGIATVAANAIFASVTGSSIASASVFTKVAIPEMLRYRYHRRFAVGVVAGSSVLGMIIPPSVMLIIYAVITEQSVGAMFIAGVVPGLLLAAAYCVAIPLLHALAPGFVGGPAPGGGWPTPGRIALGLLTKVGPVAALVLLVLGGIYGGILTPVESGAAGTVAAAIIGLAKRRLGWQATWSALVETGRITANILFLIIAASIYSRMLGIAGLPTLFGEWLASINMTFVGLMFIYVLLLLALGTIIDTASIILIVVPLFLQALEPFGIHLVWFGIVTVIGAEIGLLTPPFGISCFVIKATLGDASITLRDIFLGAAPFAAIMLGVLCVLIAFPGLSLVLL